MAREELLKIVKELRGAITQKGITPQEAKIVAEMLKNDIDESIKHHYEQYLITDKFT